MERRQKEKERKYIPFPEKEARKGTKKGEEFAGTGMVKTEGFEKGIAFLMGITRTLFDFMNNNKSFRVELFYDEESLNTNLCFYIPAAQSEKEESSQEFPIKPEEKS